MKKTTQLLTALICFALGGASVQAGTKYWDIDVGATPGAGGATPSGVWDTGTTANWNTDSTGGPVPTTWADGDTAVFSAGADAIDAFTVTVTPPMVAGGITFEEGVPTITGGTITMNAVEWPIIANTNATISSVLDDGSFGYGLKKTGPGKLTLDNGTSGYGGMNIVAEGVLAVAGANPSSALGSSLASTVVSNGAALEITTALNVTENLLLYGTGITNSGAFYARDGLGGNNGYHGVITLGSDARINCYAPGTWSWRGTAGVDGTSGNYNLTLGVFGGTLTMNSVLPGNRVLLLGSGSVTKDGNGTLRMETASIYTGGFYWNEGKIAVRTSSFSSGPIYVAAGAVELNNPNASPGIANSMILAAGANLRFNAIATGSTISYSGLISGSGGLSVTNLGKLLLSAANTYSGNTTILGNPLPAAGGGTLTLGASGSIANSPVIDVQQNATFNVTNDFVLEATQTLKCNGTCNFSNNLTLLGHLSNLGVDKSVATPRITVLGPVLTNAWVGTVTVANVGWLALAAGDSFQIFNKPLSNGLALTLVSAVGVVWTNKLEVDGSIAVVSAPAPVPSTNLTVQAVGPTSFSLSGLGVPNSVYAIFTSTNVTTPLADWWLIGTTAASAGGVISFTDSQATNDQRFYRFGQ